MTTDDGRRTGQPDTAPGPPVSVGAELRIARERRDLSVADLVRRTKISQPILEAMEQGDGDRLPAVVFTRGFVKAYAQEVGLDPELMAERYLACVSLKPSRHRADTGVVEIDPHDMRLGDDNGRILATRRASRVGGWLTAAAAVGLLAYVGSIGWSGAPDTGELPAVARARPANTAVEPATVIDTTPIDIAPPALEPASDARPAMTSVAPLQVEFKPNGSCWISVTADGTLVVERLFQAGDQRLVQAHEELVIKVGDPATCAFSINGEAGRAIGQAGKPVSIRITRDNFREFLSS
ncbi:MAG: helix-turn-helix domain-containing protein [Acidobacteriota bacterium]